MITASVRVGSSLLLEPAHELLFPLPDSTTTPASPRPRCTLSLTNLSQCNDLLFRVRTRNPDAFTVRPTYGLVPPGACCEVVVTASAKTCEGLRAVDPLDLQSRQPSELFLVQSLERARDGQAMEFLATKSSALVRELWKKVDSDCVAEDKVACRFAAVASDGVEVASSNGMASSRSLRSASASLDESRSSRSGNRSSSMSAAESRSSCSSSNCERGTSQRSLSSYLPSGREVHRSRHESVGSDTSYYTTIEPPVRVRGGSSEARRPAVTNCGVASTAGRRGTSVTNSSLSDTMMSARTGFSTDTVATESTYDSNSLHYHIQPDDALSFDVKPAPRMWGSRSFFIVNSSPDRCLMFRVRTSNQSGYVVKPSRGLVSATNALEVTVWICAPRHESEFDPTQREAKDSFLVEVANISRDKYDDLMHVDEQTRTEELRHLWTLVPRSERQSTMLAVKLKMENSDRIRSTRTRSTSDAYTDSRSRMNAAVTESRNERAKRRPVASLVEGLKELSTSSSTGASTAGSNIDYRYSDTDESVFTIAPTAVRTEPSNNDSDDNVVESPSLHGPQNSTVLVVSADRMDTIDFSNPKLSFFI
uniref:MSP domain-containing protein n=1 Tax=Peronospora matthiolae TaxID=2874970 RepID=A0AAV1TEP1_9STRA